MLFSATPYRNDYKIFNIDKTNFFALSHKKCVEENILRELEINTLKTTAKSPSTFVNALLLELKKKEKLFSSQGIAPPKVIIRCETEQEIRKVVNVLKKLKKKVIGIHQNFTDSKYYLKHVPSKENQKKYDFFVHQYKLIEGVDNPNFVVVAVYTNFKNSRQLIQQVGRVLRNPELKKEQKSYLYIDNEKAVRKEWAKYLDFDENLSETRQLFDVTDILKVNKEATSLYFQGSFRDIIRVRHLELKKSLVFQLKLNAYTIQDPLCDFDYYSELLLDSWGKRDFNILKYEIDGDVMLVLYIQYDNSRIIKNGVFVEQTLVATYLRKIGNHIYIHDSENNNPFGRESNLEPMDKDTLTKLLANSKGINSVFLQNTDIGTGAIRTKELKAYKLESTGYGFSDSMYFTSRVQGVIKEDDEYKKRYLGFTYGKVSERSSKRLEFDDFNSWVKNIDEALRKSYSKSSNNRFFDRFAEVVKSPTSYTPVSILIDIDDDTLSNYYFGDDSADVYIENKAAVVENETFKLTVNDDDYTVKVNYDTKRKKYQLECTELNSKIHAYDENEPSLFAYLNQTQSFRIVIENNKYIYASNYFYAPSKNLISKKRELDLAGIFYSNSIVSNTTSEKGSAALKTNGNVWHKNTLFGLIARKGKGYGDKALENIFDFEYMICDDIGKEIADFVAINKKKKKVVFIHAKCGNSKLSASSFQEICGQAVKNLNYLMPSMYKAPVANIKRWDEKWTLKDVGKANRIFPNRINGQNFWAQYTELLSDPSTSKEVWLFVGNTFDFDLFKTEINRAKIELVKPEVIQLIYLLRSTWQSVASASASLKVFC